MNDATGKTGGTKTLGAPEAPAPDGDRALVIGRMADDALAVLRKRSADAPVEAGVIRPLREGQPIVGEVVKLTPVSDRPGEPIVCDVEVQLAAPTHAAAQNGPPRVATERYRAGWDNVFGAVREKSRAN